MILYATVRRDHDLHHYLMILREDLELVLTKEDHDLQYLLRISSSSYLLLTTFALAAFRIPEYQYEPPRQN